MDKEIKNLAMQQRTGKISWLFILLVIAMVLFLFSILGTISSDRHIPSQNAIIHDRSFRGAIISADNYTLSASRKIYQAVIRGESIDPDKKEMFITLFGIYSGIPKQTIRKRFSEKNGKGNIILSKTLNAKQAMQLKALAYKLRQLKVFRSIKVRSGLEVLYGLDIIEVGESRRFPLSDVLSPVLGYVRKKSDGHYTRPQGQKGLERKYEKHITSKKDGYFKGKRDVGGNIIHDKNSIEKQRVDGMDLYLNIPLAFQRRIEMMVDTMKKRIDADEILVGVMESNTGKVLALASSERYNPSHITQSDIAALNPKFAEYPYEAGSVLKPITLALALDKNLVTPQTVFNTFNGRMKIGKRRTITDDEKFPSLNATDIIVHSSNVGISQISWRLTGKEFRDGLLAFGFARPSGIDLSRDLPGRIKSERLLNHQMHRANSSYGYGMMVTFAQLFKAYSAFNNDGVAVTPRLADYLEDAKGRHYVLPPTVGDLHPIGKKAARQIHEILKEVVMRGTGVKAQYPGLEIGGKTGTAHIARHGRYVREYHSSFYGFANDKEGHKYTIGVLVIRAKKYRHYFASKSAVPTFKNTVRILVEQGYLKPDPTVEAKVSKDIPLYGDKSTEAEVAAPILPPLPKEKTPPPVTREKPQKVIPVPHKKPKKRVISPIMDEAADLF
ncbi:peptidoglycan D,D-transpeptidase FtsI family protein [Sulfurovum sp. ST-21]|uniref:Penicillin-binding protein 2 n=1 Tax=Sulfurovum indicum TaxID=2779528 RepID=A0A7M1S3P8_9BACT|nr:penicillin-binding protein 2 [Sulfurovum indicum]QOR61621.1 penicillin-binding protein 2 [Sulfurovum indicum]